MPNAQVRKPRPASAVGGSPFDDRRAGDLASLEGLQFVAEGRSQCVFVTLWCCGGPARPLLHASEHYSKAKDCAS